LKRRAQSLTDNPVVSVIAECDSPMGPNGEKTHVDLRYED